MFHASEENKLYNFTKGTQTDIALKSGTEEIDLNVFLDDISIWMENHKDIISNKYLPFSCLAVGLVPSQASAFVYGCFVGRAMERKGVTVAAEEGPINQKEIAHTIKEDIQSQMGWLKNMLKHLKHIENEDDPKNEQV
jgi:hypothetical protein